MWTFINRFLASVYFFIASTLSPSQAPREPVSALDCRNFVRANGDLRPFVIPETEKGKESNASLEKGENDTEQDEQEENSEVNPETQEQDQSSLIRIVSYNILAPFYTNERFKKYPYTSGSNIEWDYRMPRIVKELQLLDGDIVGLQEVDADYWEGFKEKLQEIGYNSIFLKKTDPKRDGVAVLYRPEKYTLYNFKEVILDDLALEDSPSTAADVGMLQHQVALIASFVTQDGRLILYANIHVYYYWLRPDVQSVQVGILLHEIEKFRQELLSEMKVDSEGSSSERMDIIPVVLCGDFNAVPGSWPHLLISTRNLAGSASAMDALSALPVFANVSSDTDSDGASDGKTDKTQNPFLHRLKHNVQLESAYKQILGKDSLTNFAADFQGTLDYIWVSPYLEVEEVLDVVPQETRRLHYACPNHQYPSDHFSLLATLRLPKKSLHWQRQSSDQ